MKETSAEKFFTEEERQRIALAVTEAEQGTSGEIATMVVARSDSYCEASSLAAVLAAAFVSLVLAIASHHVTIWSYLPITFLLYFPARHAICRLPRLQRPLIRRGRMEECVRQRAVRAFYEKGLYRTRNETGILIFISLFEHKVWILGDRGIDARIPAEAWQKYARLLSAGIGEGRACEALCGVVAACGEELARHFPRQADDRDELPNEPLS